VIHSRVNTTKSTMTAALPSYLRSSCLKVKTLDESLWTCSTLNASSSSRSMNASPKSLSRSLHAVRNNINLRHRHSLPSCYISSPIPHAFLDNSQRTYLNEQDAIEEEQLQRNIQTPSSSRPKQSVSFGQVDVRLYEMSTSDNPAVSRGPAIQLGWEYKHELSLSVDDFESTQKPNVAPKTDELKILEFERVKILQRSGFSPKEIRLASERSARGRNLRLKTTRKINRAVADGKLNKFDDHKSLRRRLYQVFSCRMRRRETKLAKATIAF
jgi:hypothetical protein